MSITTYIHGQANPKLCFTGFVLAVRTRQAPGSRVERTALVWDPKNQEVVSVHYGTDHYGTDTAPVKTRNVAKVDASPDAITAAREWAFRQARQMWRDKGLTDESELIRRAWRCVDIVGVVGIFESRAMAAEGR